MKREKISSPYGSWDSPITADLIVRDAVRAGQVYLDGSDIYWTELRPSNKGRVTLVRWSEGTGAVDVTPPDMNVRTRVHEYGGGNYIVHNQIVYFVNFADQRLYRQVPGGEPQAMTPAGACRYADMVWDEPRQRLIAVCEDHSDETREPVNSLVAIGLDGTNNGRCLVLGNDFYAAPRLSPDGRYLSWLTWNHPNMPWDGCELWQAEITPEGDLSHATLVAGGPQESIFQPMWSPDGLLYFVSDRTGWWNLYRLADGQIEALCPMEAEFGVAQWVFHLSTYDFESAENIICFYTSNGRWHLARLHIPSHQLTPLLLPYGTYDGNNMKVKNGIAVFSCGSASVPDTLVRYRLADSTFTILQQSNHLDLDSETLSLPVPLEFPTTYGQTAHGYYYPPQNVSYLAPESEYPPLLVLSHGGPTSSASTILSLGVQYWTNRGFAVLDVDYSGSEGYGRAYRQRLNGQWGLLDVQDCIDGAQYLVQQGKADPRRLAIRGGSAGGYTTLCALTFHNVFSAGASHFGVSDLETLAQDTHKFESRYLHTLVASYPEHQEIYKTRSPIHFVDQINCPLILFQGLEDKVVPPSQSEAMFLAVRNKELPVAYLAFEGEQHGFRQSENIKRTLEAELYFYSRIFHFELPGHIEPVLIENL